MLWRTDVFGWTWGTPLVVGERIYAGAAGGTPYFFHHVAGFSVLDRKSGRILERWPLPDSAGAHQWGIAGSPALAGGTLVVTTIEGSVYGFGGPSGSSARAVGMGRRARASALRTPAPDRQRPALA